MIHLYNTMLFSDKLILNVFTKLKMTDYIYMEIIAFVWHPEINESIVTKNNFCDCQKFGMR